VRSSLGHSNNVPEIAYCQRRSNRTLYFVFKPTLISTNQASLITEEENEQINSDDKTFAFLLRLIQTSLKSADHFSRVHRMTAAEGIESLNLLAANDNNKDRIVRSGALPCYVELLKTQSSVEEQIVSTKGLWNLAFKCADDIKKESGCIEGRTRRNIQTNRIKFI